MAYSRDEALELHKDYQETVNNWQYYVRSGSVDEMRPDSDRNQKLVRIWQRLPVWLTKIIGPPIVRGIP